MAEVVGFLRKNATHGEKTTLKLLKQNLPKEFTVYVETPLHKKRDIRYPDFIILTNYGVIVLEVKDWAFLRWVDPTGATIKTRSGEERHEPNPVLSARDFAIILSNELKEKQKQKQKHSDSREKIPWSYAALIANFPYSVITQLQSAWGEEFVWGEDDLIVPALLQKRLKEIFPADRLRSLSRSELDQIRSVIFPVVEIEMAGREPFVLDLQQEKIVAEPVQEEVIDPKNKTKPVEQASFAGQLFETDEPLLELPPQGERISRNVAIRLVRGFSGSGKTLVLTQRAKYLAAQFPEDDIAILTYNNQLQKHLESNLIGSNVRVQTFHSLCQSYLHKEGDSYHIKDWLEEYRYDYSIILNIGLQEIESEINWMRDMALSDEENYYRIQRHGIGAMVRITSEQRKDIFIVYKEYRKYLKENNLWDWSELPLLLLEEIESGNIIPKLWNAILIDEAQDWAPCWLKLISNFLIPGHGLLFLADDPSQSIYRYFSWKEKGVNVVGRTRWLRVPYRNTYEIYQAAYSMIADHSEIQSSLSEEGELVKPDLSSSDMRHGSRPLIRKCSSISDEYSYIRSNIDVLRKEGFRDEQIAVLTRYRTQMEPIKSALKGTAVLISQCHGFKGLEMDVIIIPHIHETFKKDDEVSDATERRLLYMAMSRARSQLIMTYSSKLPNVYDQLRKNELVDFV